MAHRARRERQQRRLVTAFLLFLRCFVASGAGIAGALVHLWGNARKSAPGGARLGFPAETGLFALTGAARVEDNPTGPFAGAEKGTDHECSLTFAGRVRVRGRGERTDVGPGSG